MSSVWSDLQFESTSQGCTLYPIDDQSVLSISGPDSHKFMQGQFTCHLNDVSPNQYRPGACCNAKGRMVTSFNLLQIEEGHYLISMHASLTETTQNHLKKYMVFFKTQMQASEYVLAGLTGPNAGELLTAVFEQSPQAPFEQVHAKQSLVVKLPHEAGFMLYLHPDTAKDVLSEIAKSAELGTNERWNEGLIRHGLGYITQATSEAFIPQMLNLNQQGGISFNKGCYTGQEIVARMQYLGKLKRHMYRVAFDGTQNVNSGDDLFVSDKSSPAGQVVFATNLQQQAQALVVIEDKILSHIANGELKIGPNRVQVKELLSLPYDVIDAQPE